MGNGKDCTIFCDIDGSILAHRGTLINIYKHPTATYTGTPEKFHEWWEKGYTIILTTARPESMRHYTERQLESVGIVFHQLVMNCGHGPRYVLNDRKPDGADMAIGITLERDEGIANVDI